MKKKENLEKIKCLEKMKKAGLLTDVYTTGWIRGRKLMSKYIVALEKLRFKDVDSASIGDSWTSISVDKWVNKKADLKALIEHAGGYKNYCSVKIVPLRERHTYTEWDGHHKTL